MVQAVRAQISIVINKLVLLLNLNFDSTIYISIQSLTTML